jgi:hypothetical protein
LAFISKDFAHAGDPTKRSCIGLSAFIAISINIGAINYIAKKPILRAVMVGIVLFPAA